jgi:hypothetical protein
MQLFSADPIVFSQKKIKKKIDPENMKKPPSKVAHNRPPTIFFQYWPGCPNGPKTEIPYLQKPLNAGLGTEWNLNLKLTYLI